MTTSSNSKRQSSLSQGRRWCQSLVFGDYLTRWSEVFAFNNAVAKITAISAGVRLTTPPRVTGLEVQFKSWKSTLCTTPGKVISGHNKIQVCRQTAGHNKIQVCRQTAGHNKIQVCRQTADLQSFYLDPNDHRFHAYELDLIHDNDAVPIVKILGQHEIASQIILTKKAIILCYKRYCARQIL
jgi:hypothetical protein